MKAGTKSSVCCFFVPLHPLQPGSNS